MSGRRHTVENHQQLHLVAAADLTPRRVSQVFEVCGDGNQVGLDLQVHLPILVGLHHLTPHTHTLSILYPVIFLCRNMLDKLRSYQEVGQVLHPVDDVLHRLQRRQVDADLQAHKEQDVFCTLEYVLLHQTVQSRPLTSKSGMLGSLSSCHSLRGMTSTGTSWVTTRLLLDRVGCRR